MTDAAKPDYRPTVFLPKTGFPMKAGLAEKEPALLARWQADGLYRRLRAARAGREKFILHDGPPYANGDMHIGHALNHILKDMVARTQSALGKDAPYVPGWDCHGLPIEWKVEEKYRSKKLNKDEVPAAEFRAECRAYAQNWVDVQREQLKRLGINGDWDHPYLTMDFAAEATIVAELLKFAASGQLYRGAKPVMWSPVEKTALAEAEVEYEDITSTQIDVAFEITHAPNAPELVGAHAVIWTTTPWTIPVNQALAYGPEVEYVLLRRSRVGFFDGFDEARLSQTVQSIVDNGHNEDTLAYFKAMDKKLAPGLANAGLDGMPESIIVAEPLVAAFNARIAKKVAEYDWLQDGLSGVEIEYMDFGDAIRLKGSDLAGAIARHPMHRLGGFFAKPRPFLPGDFVTTEQGTGLVHMAPDHGEDDFLLCKANGIDPVFAVEGDGRYRADWAWLGGQGSVIAPKLNAPDGPICTDLRAAGALLAASQDYRHSYPHSWRSKAKLIFRCTPQWFIPMDKPLAAAAGSGEAQSTAPAHSPLPLEGGGDSRVSAAGGGGLPRTTLLSDDSGPRTSDDGDKPLPAFDGGAATLTTPTRAAPSGASLASPLQGEEKTLRATALTAIENTRWVPAKGENRIRAMVEGRPDWVISRQRAWGVPITLFVHRTTGAYLDDPAVNARIVAAVMAGGVDAWNDANAQALLGADHAAADYERVTDILDVWFDSGCTHAFVLESGKWPELLRPAGYDGPPADLYLEGSDQHRGWFQSSLMESCGTRGRAPYKAVLTHGFTMDNSGRKMSKSLGNTVDPIVLMKDYGADILRLWALTVDFTEDHRIGKEILGGVADQYRKLRNTFRYLLGALDGFSDAERVTTADMPELERWVLHRVAEIDAELRRAIGDFDFNSYVTTISNFVNADLSAFYFDIRKDSLYCDAPTSAKRRACRTVLDHLFHALTHWLAPVLVFTAEEVWLTRFPDAGSVHLGVFADVEDDWLDGVVAAKWVRLRELRGIVTSIIEPMRRSKEIGSSLECDVEIHTSDIDALEYAKSVDFTEICIAASVRVIAQGHDIPDFMISEVGTVQKSENDRCDRCWRYLPDVAPDTGLCGRCAEAIG